MRLVIDISNTFHKSYAVVSNYAGFDITEEKWQLTLGRKFITDLLSLIKRFDNVNEVILAFDSDNYFRKQVRADYKGDRVKKQQEFYDLLNELEKVLLMKGFDVYNISGLEADDILNLISDFYDKFNILISNDEDVRVSVNNNTVVFTGNNSNYKVFCNNIKTVAQNIPSFVQFSEVVNKNQIFYEKLLLGCKGDNVTRLLPAGNGPKKVSQIIKLIFEDEYDLQNALKQFGFDISYELINEQMKMVCLGKDYIPEELYNNFAKKFKDSNKNIKFENLELDMKQLLQGTRFIL